MQHADINISKITIFYEHLKWYLSRTFQHSTPNETPHKTQDLESEPSVPRFRTTISSPNTKCKSSFTPAARSGGSPASSPVAISQAKIWNIHINPVNHAYYYFSKTNPINYDTYQETEPNYNNSIIIIQRLHLRKSSLHQYTNITQSRNTFQHLNIQPSQWCYNFEKVSSFRKCWTFSLTHIIISEDSLCAHAEANTPRRTSHSIFLPRITA
jgi:hypothetical protein